MNYHSKREVTSIPIVFIHTGNQGYLKKVIKLAERSNSKVYLIGDETNKSYCKNWVDASGFDISDYMEFRKIYIHMSTNSAKFELGCFKRYYLLYAFMEVMHFKACFMLDSDTCVYQNLTRFKLGKYDVACGLVYDLVYDDASTNLWCASPHSSFWKKNALKNFLDYLYFIYDSQDPRLKKFWKDYLDTSQPGGVSDMSLLGLWLKDIHPTWKNLAVVGGGGKRKYAFDDNVNEDCNYVGQEYQMRNLLFDRKIKKIYFVKGKAYMINMKNQKIETPIIHAQGSAKRYISCFARKRNSILFYYLADAYNDIRQRARALRTTMKRYYKHFISRDWGIHFE